MKRFILCIVLFIALMTLTAGSYFYIIGTTSKLMNKVEFVAKSLTEGEYDAGLQAAHEIDELWVSFRRRRYLIIDRDNIAEITASLARIKALTEEENYDQGNTCREVNVECTIAISLLRQYAEKQKINIYNIL